MAIVHVTPVNDLRAHAEDGADCWCEPDVLDEGVDAGGDPARVIVHHSADGRERREGLPRLIARLHRWVCLRRHRRAARDAAHAERGLA